MQPASLGETAALLRRDLFLVLYHLHTLPLIFGSPRWWLFQRNTLSRPFSELSPTLYPFELTRIIVQAVISCLIVGCLYPILVLSLAAYYFFDVELPLRAAIFVLSRIFTSRPFSIKSRGNITTNSLYLHELLHGGREYIAIPSEGPQELWIFVNGVMEQGAMVDATCYLLEKMTGRIVNPFINRSNGVALDLLECIVGRTLNATTTPAVNLVARIVPHLARGRRVILLGHSQGGIILSNVVKQLTLLARQHRTRKQIISTAALPSEVHLPRAIGAVCQDAEAHLWRPNADGCARSDRAEMQYSNEEEQKLAKPVLLDDPQLAEMMNAAFVDELERLEVYTFGSAADEFEKGPLVEHFAAELDFVARIGALNFSGALDRDGSRRRSAWNGQMHVLPTSAGAQGHLMKEMLLPAMRNGLFGQSSVFWNKYCNVKSDKHIAIKRHFVESVLSK